MAPKRKSAAAASSADAGASAEPEAPAAKAKAKAKVKTELCVAGLTGRALSNAVSYRLKRAPPHVQEWYRGKVKSTKTMASQEMREFFRQLLEDGACEGEYFEKLRVVANEDLDKETNTWLSWTRLKAMDSEPILKLAIKQGRIQHRPHKLLADAAAEDETVSALDWYEKQEYMYVEESTETIKKESHQWTAGLVDSAEEEEEAATGTKEEAPAVDPRVAMKSEVERCLRQIANQEIDIDGRISRFQQNEYVERSATEAAKQMKVIKKSAAKVKKMLADAMGAENPSEGAISEVAKEADELNTAFLQLKKKLASMKTFVDKQ